VSEGITSVLSALGFLNPGLHLMQTLFIFLNLEQSSQLLRILLITCNFSFTSLWDIQSLQHTLWNEPSPQQWVENTILCFQKDIL
jgi:hypothetical protein